MAETLDAGSAGDNAPVSGLIRRSRVFGFSFAALVFLLDQATKWVVAGPLQLRERGTIELIPFFDLSWVENRGISMSLYTAGSDATRWMLVCVTLLIAMFVSLWLWREKARGDVFGLALVLGGALGNILDRVRFGYVVDFADLHFGGWQPFLVFNLADAAISIGVLILLLRALFRYRGDKAMTETANG